MTDEQNARLRRTIVNRLWGRFFGRALVEPVDEIDNPAWNEDVLDFLAANLQANGDDLKHLMQQIVTSRAYQLPSVGAEPIDSKQFIFRGPQVRRLTAEQLLDTIWMTTDAGPAQPAGSFNPAGSAAAGSLAGQWIWSYAEGSESVPKPGEQIMLRRKIALAARPQKAWAVITCDNEFTLWVNGQKLAGSKDWQQPKSLRLDGALKAGANEILILARNAGDGPNAAALFFEARISLPGGEELPLASDGQWEWTSAVPDASGKLPGDEVEWKPAVAVQNQNFLPGDIRDKLALAARALVDGLVCPGGAGHGRSADASAGPADPRPGRDHAARIVHHVGGPRLDERGNSGRSADAGSRQPACASTPTGPRTRRPSSSFRIF